MSNIQEVKARKGKIIAIVTEGDTAVKETADALSRFQKRTKFLFRFWLRPTSIVVLSYCSDERLQRRSTKEPGKVGYSG